jgi:heterodisulfide reductase subunit D
MEMPKITMKPVKLPRVAKELTQCQMCGYCIEVCEAHGQTPWESVTARGKIYYLNQLDKAGTGAMDFVLNRKVTLSPEFVDAMYKCTGCGNCEAVCHAKIELVALWERLRAWMVQEGVAPLPVHKKLAESIAKNGNPYNEPKSKRDAWWPENVKRSTPPEAIFFAGCTGSYRMQDIPKAAVTILDRAGVKVNCLGEDEYCCTSPALRTGVRDLTMKAAETVVVKADSMGAKDMVMSCAGCYKTVSTNFGEFYSKPGQNVYHITQYVDKLIKSRKLPLNNAFGFTVTYHDPCHLGRHSGVFEEPRNILKAIPGVKFVEMKRNRMNSRCCGAGGGYKSAYNNFAVNIAAERIRDAEEVGAEIIATACPFCVLNLKAGAKQIGSKIKVMDITEILLQVTGPKVVPAAAKPAPGAATAGAQPAAAAAAVAASATVASSAANVAPAAASAGGSAVSVKPAATPVKAEEAQKPAVVEKATAPAKTEEAQKPAEVKKDEVPAKTEPAGVPAKTEEAQKPAEVKKDEVPAKTEAAQTSATGTSSVNGATVAGAAAAGAVAGAAVAAAASEDNDEEGETEEDFEVMNFEMNPEGIVRRAAWNKGLRCRRNYGIDNVQVAFVKSKVAVYVTPDGNSTAKDDKLRNDGWVVLRYKEADISDGQKQAEEIKTACKENLRNLKKKAKKKK